MTITCSHCRSQFKIAEDKLPPGARSTTFTCPKCRARATVDLPPPAAPAASRVSLNEIDTSGYNPADRPFDFVEEEGKTALVCEQHPALRKTVLDTLELMEYQITAADSARDALKRMRYHVYDLVVVNDDFDSGTPDANGVLIYLERLTLAARRTTYVVMITDRHRTMDNMTAFMKSVNLIVNTKNIEDFTKILSRGLTDHLAFYRVMREKLAEFGRA
jgi:predicted Zn finger-like uncharacterized protein